MFFSENYQARNISFESDWGGGSLLRIFTSKPKKKNEKKPHNLHVTSLIINILMQVAKRGVKYAFNQEKKLFLKK